MEITELYEPSVVRISQHPYLLVSVNGRHWQMISSTQVSGQMSFRDITRDVGHRDLKSQDFKKQFIEANIKYGVTNNGWINGVFRSVTQKALLEKCSEAVGIMGYKELKNPFLSIEQGFPFISDGKIGFRLKWEGTGGVSFGRIEQSKCYRILEDPCIMNIYGMLLTPITTVMERLNEHFVLFADPFAVRQRGTTNRRDVLTISPGKRDQARKRTRTVKT